MISSIIIFFISATCIWLAGTSLVRFADEIAYRKELGQAFIGLILLATVTELPEIATTLTASVQGNAALALNNLFGGITLQTTILAVVDAFVVRGVLTFYPRKPTHALEAALLITLMTILLGICVVGEIDIGWQLGAGSIALAIAYGFAILLLRRYEAHSDWVPVEFSKIKTPARERSRQQTESMRLLYCKTGLASIVILLSGIALTNSAENIALQSELGSGFVGASILAASTSLPELSTTIAAARIGAFSMAISNIFGSNLIMVALLLPADIFYRNGPILSQAGQQESLALIGGILVTTIYVLGILVRRKPRVAQMGIDSIAVFFVYVGSIIALYLIR